MIPDPNNPGSTIPAPFDPYDIVDLATISWETRDEDVYVAP
jgi:hypothetical protein